MRVAYDGHDLDVELDDITTKQAIVIQGYTGMTVKPWLEAFEVGDAKAVTAFAWLAFTQSGQTIAITDLDIKVFKFLEAIRSASAPVEPDPNVAAAEAAPSPTTTPEPSAETS